MAFILHVLMIVKVSTSPSPSGIPDNEDNSPQAEERFDGFARRLEQYL